MRKLHAFADALLPFVHRGFAGNRLRRTLLGSSALAVLTVMIGLWLALGSGGFERHMRSNIGLEANRWEYQRTTFTVVTDDPTVYASRMAERRSRIAAREHNVEANGYHLDNEVRRGVSTLQGAIDTRAPAEFATLQREAEVLLRERGSSYSEASGEGFNWSDPKQVQRLNAVLDARLIPNVELYESPLSIADSATLAGLTAAGFLILLCFVAAPTLIAWQVAQEVHDNTLAPLRGTALTSTQLASGLIVGPLAGVVLLAVPQAIIVVTAAMVTGFPIAASAFVVHALTVGLALTAFAGVLGFAVGSRRPSGLVAVGVASLAGIIAFAGAGAGLALRKSTIGLLNVLPQASSWHLLRESFLPSRRLWAAQANEADVAIFVGAALAIAAAGLAFRVLRARIAGTYGPSLGRAEAFGGALLASIATILALTGTSSSVDPDLLVYGGLMMTAAPFAALLAARTPIGDVPTALRPLPTRSLLAELGSHVALYIAMASTVLALGLFSEGSLYSRSLDFHALGAVNMVWAYAVGGLVVMRGIRGTQGAARQLWVGLCLGLVMLTYVQGVIIMDDGLRDGAFLLSRVSPALGFVQFALTMFVPVALWRSLRK